METASIKNERVEIRISSYDKQIIKRAVKLSGDSSLGSFIVRVVKAHAEDIISRSDRILVSEKDRKVFFKAVFDDAKPNSNLINAAKRYNSQTDSH